METLAIRIALIVVGVFWSAVAKLHVVLLGRPVVIPWLGVVAAGVVLVLAVMVLYLARLLVQDGLRSRPRWATA